MIRGRVEIGRWAGVTQVCKSEVVCVEICSQKVEKLALFMLAQELSQSEIPP